MLGRPLIILEHSLESSRGWTWCVFVYIQVLCAFSWILKKNRSIAVRGNNSGIVFYNAGTTASCISRQLQLDCLAFTGDVSRSYFSTRGLGLLPLWLFDFQSLLCWQLPPSSDQLHNVKWQSGQEDPFFLRVELCMFHLIIHWGPLHCPSKYSINQKVNCPF